MAEAPAIRALQGGPHHARDARRRIRAGLAPDPIRGFREQPSAPPDHAYLGHAGVLAVSSQRGHAVGADLVAALGAEQRALDTVPSGRRSDEAGTAVGVDAFFRRFTFVGVRVQAL
jgi:hypothetical protein